MQVFGDRVQTIVTGEPQILPAVSGLLHQDSLIGLCLSVPVCCVACRRCDDERARAAIHEDVLGGMPECGLLLVRASVASCSVGFGCVVLRCRPASRGWFLLCPHHCSVAFCILGLGCQTWLACEAWIRMLTRDMDSHADPPP